MRNFKRVDGDYTVQLVNDTDVLTLDSNTVTVTGNLEVTGNVTYINTEQVNVKDPFLLLNDNEGNTFASNSGIIVHKTATTFAGLRYNDDANQWEISTSTDVDGETGTWGAIAGGSAGSVAGNNTEVQYNDNGSFGADGEFRWFSGSNQLRIDGAITLVKQTQANIPEPVSNTQVLFSGNVSSGGTGVYVTTEDDNREELVSKSKAIVFGIIF